MQVAAQNPWPAAKDRAESVAGIGGWLLSCVLGAFVLPIAVVIIRQETCLGFFR